MIAASTLVGLGHSDLRQIVVVVFVTNVVYFATHVFAYFLGDPDVDGRGSLRVAMHHLRVSAPMVSAAFVPLLTVIVFSAFGLHSDTAVFSGVLVAVLYLATVATAGAFLRGHSALVTTITALVTIALAAAIVLAKLGLH